MTPEEIEKIATCVRQRRHLSWTTIEKMLEIVRSQGAFHEAFCQPKSEPVQIAWQNSDDVFWVLNNDGLVQEAGEPI